MDVDDDPASIVIIQHNIVSPDNYKIQDPIRVGVEEEEEELQGQTKPK